MSTEQNQSNFFVRRPIVAMVIAIIMTIVGSVSIIGLPIEQYPNLTPPIVEVRGTYTGASALNVEQSVATPLEQEINGVENMIYMKSINSNDGTMTIQTSFDIGTDPDMNTVFTQNRVAAATPKLPNEVKRTGVKTEKSLPNILMLITLVSPDGRFDQNFLGNYSLINIKDVLARTKGIGRVNVLGTSDYSMRIWIKPDILAKLNLTIPEITNAISNQNVIVPGGKFGAEPAPKGTEFTYTVRLPDRLQDEDQFSKIVVRTDEDGSQVLLGDVARVELGVETYSAFTRLNGDNCAVIAIYQAPGSNAVALAEEVIGKMDALKKDFPNGIDYKVSLDSTLPITAGINEIIETLFVALLLVILVVYVFIQDWRATLVPTMAIPVSLVAAFMLFPLLGFTINVLSLLGLVLAIGIVVDDAIVVVDAVQVYIEEGFSPKEATNKAMIEVTAPVIATTLVLVAVFIPVAGMAGITGRLYQQFAITVAVSVCFSSLNALTLSPALCGLILRKSEPVGGPLGAFFKVFNNIFDRSTVSYISVTKIATRKLKSSAIFIFCTLLAAGWLGVEVPVGFIPEEDQGYLYVNVQLPMASSLQRTNDLSLKIEGIMDEIPEIDMVTTVAGYSLLSSSMSTNSAFFFVTLTNWDKRELTAKEVTNKLNYLFMTQITEAQVFAFGPPAIPGLGNGSGFSIMIQDKGGNTPDYLANYTNEFIRAANARPEIGMAFTTFQANVPQRYIDINKDKILKLGVNLNDVYTTFGAFLGGSYINDFNRFGRLYRAYVQAEPEYRNDEKQLDLFYVKSAKGAKVPLSTLVNVEKISGPEFTNRFNLLRSVEVTGSPAEGFSSAQAMAALEEVAAEVLPRNMTFAWNGMSYQEKKASGSVFIIFAFSLIFVFLILAAQYESWSMPFSILLGTPFAIFGAFLLLWVARFFSESYENNVFAQISLVMLIAMAAKNAILIVEFAKLKFDEGMGLFDAAIESAKLRFRPILMTAFSFILGVLPLVIATGSGAEARKVMGMALLGGMGLATVLGLFLYPMLFVLVGKLAGYEKDRETTPQNNEE
ncbi:efflux RND transporter permease subunit [Flammeovirga kamogawensis]|uniref:Efflux RND transporter permease subunit n=1 Tax=Flammeovirga kamogawensis TaxID=373891 RepID=A0ABX8GQC1_9BACT|nr:efflux RND transporter permease subunit [Flammeovirga kamogawensis]MBB6462049.1 HAE1 family hydrophobic/amphiphilic exporter-1 [Flammeovirga kamogawensis]QWG05784.1 efflux RND transporter permease subunit [Flammeovirga kamogawensis]TRX67611.1 efflux RND transporter permease subunit [Flammeovirga kamogawensis]